MTVSNCQWHQYDSEIVMSANHRFRREIQESTPFSSQYGASIGLVEFWYDQNKLNNCDSSGAYVPCIYRGLGVKINICEKLHGAQERACELRSCEAFLCRLFLLKYLQLELSGCQHHYKRRYRISRISVLNLWYGTDTNLFTGTCALCGIRIFLLASTDII